MTLVSIACGLGDLRDFYLLNALSRHWAARGIRTTVGPAFDTTADLGILHVDRSFVRDRDLSDPPPGRAVLNWTIRNITKRRLSLLRVLPGDDWDGPVIVKTNLNSFGRPEAQQRGFVRPTPQDRNRARMARISWRSARQIPDGTYPVLHHLRAVPGWVWEDDRLIVERFIPERDGDLYCIRGWVFFGTRGYGWRLRSTHPTAKVGGRVDHEYLTDVPPELQDLRARHGFDFGKFDYVVHDGRPFVFDMNKTPSFHGAFDSPRLTDLSRGIEDYL